jgi:lambda repressor-like predicted transcriptional regulator
LPKCGMQMRVDLDKLNRYRIHAGLSVADHARAAGLRYHVAMDTLKGKSAAPAAVCALCRALGISPRLIWRS